MILSNIPRCLISDLPQQMDTASLDIFLQNWILSESDPSTMAILSTVNENNKPSSRVVAIREINERGALFFTQKGSIKVRHIAQNDYVSLTFYLPKYKRQITFEGKAVALTQEENKAYWKTYPKEAQIRFSVYGPYSGEALKNNSQLDHELNKAKEIYKNTQVDHPEAYIGFRVVPEIIKLYQYNTDRISDSLIGEKKEGQWSLQKVVP